MDVIKLLTAKPVCIYVIRNWESKKVYVGYSTKSLISSVNNAMNLIGGKIRSEDTRKLEFGVVEECDSRNIYYIKYMVDNTYQNYFKEGYTLYTPYKPLEWSIQVRIGKGRGVDGRMQQKAFVELMSQTSSDRGAKLRHLKRLKVCDTIEEANLYASNGIERLLLLLG